MSATSSWLNFQNQSTGAAMALPTCSFSALMKDENKALAQGLQRRDPQLLDSLIEQYQFRLFRYLLYITGDRTRAEDFFQETWIRVLERGHQYDGKSRFEGWLFAIARNLVIDWQRQRKVQSLDALTDSEQPHPLQITDERRPSALQAVLASEQDEQVQGAMGQLAAVYREVLLLRFQEELQIEEIAAVLGAPASTVKSRLYRGLEALRNTLQPGVA
jgi:RNA polymerase sigma-70 factor (ECF subfamily)